jgi:hypothetical protein
VQSRLISLPNFASKSNGALEYSPVDKKLWAGAHCMRPSGDDSACDLAKVPHTQCHRFYFFASLLFACVPRYQGQRHESLSAMGSPALSSTHTTGWTKLLHQQWKGKERAIDVDLDGRDEGTGGEGGVVLSLALVGNGVYDA